MPMPHKSSNSPFTVLRSGDGHLSHSTGDEARNPYDPATDHMSGEGTGLQYSDDEISPGKDIY